MKSKQWLAIIISIFVCLCAGSLAAIGAGYFWLKDQPPHRLSDRGTQTLNVLPIPQTLTIETRSFKA